VLADTAYGGGTRAALTAAGHLQPIKPIPLRPAVPGGFTKDDFTIDLQARTVTCPAGQTVAITPGGRAVFDWRGGRCPLGERCTTAKDGKTVNLHPHDAELVAARRQATTPAFQASDRRWRPMVERSIAWLVAGGHRRVRYRGLAATKGLDYGEPGGCSLTGRGPGLSMRDVPTATAIQRGRLAPTTPALRIGHLPGHSESMTGIAIREAGCSAGS